MRSVPLSLGAEDTDSNREEDTGTQIIVVVTAKEVEEQHHPLLFYAVVIEERQRTTTICMSQPAFAFITCTHDTTCTCRNITAQLV